MKVAIDLSQIIYGTGVSHYRENLVRNLLKIDTKNEYLLYAGSFRRKKDILSYFPQTKVFPIPSTLADIIWNKLHILPIEKLIGKFDLVHTSDWAEPPSIFPKITTIHDLIPLKFPKVTPPVIVAAHKERLKWVKKESRRIIVPSQTTKKDLVEFGFNEDLIKVIYEAPNLKKANEQEIIAIKAKYRIHDDYIIAIGTNMRKNINRIIDAYNLSKSGKNLKLLIVGEKKGIEHEDQRGVRFLGHVEDSDLGPLLTGSKALIFPSIYEGLGIPILDGFNCEVPVVTSNIGSMKEISEDASILVDPYDVNSIADGIRKALEAPKALITKGLKKVAEFSWKKTAEETLEVYKEISEK
jgi:glycosyltransferase involved in cell wall biosynthesis